MSVGETLARAREQRGMSVEDVSTATRIRAGLIRQIENDDFSACGGAVYARGHIRGIARYVGVDAEPLVQEFDRAHSDEPPPNLVPTPRADADAVAAADRRGPNWTAAMAVALVVICILAAVGLIHSGGGGNRKLAANPPPTHPTVQSSSPAPTSSAPTPPKNSLADAYNARKATALVRIRSDQSSPSWISGQPFSAAGGVYQATLSPGQQHQFTDPQGLCLVIGNVLAVQLVANGTEVHIPRTPGGSVVTHVTIAKGKAPTFHSGPTSVCP